MSAQCVLLDRARHVPPPARESYIHRISTDRRRDTADAPARETCVFDVIHVNILPAIRTTTHICDRVMDLGNTLGQEPTQHTRLHRRYTTPTDRCY